MLSRTARKLETTLLVSRQSLPRPARLLAPRTYSSPSKPAKSPATAALLTQEYPAYIPPLPSSSSASTSALPHHDQGDSIVSFLSRQAPFTILPAPLPKEDHHHDTVFTDTVTQDKLAVMDACLFNLYNVTRARTLFNNVRHDKQSVMTVEIYNRILDAYFKMAAKEPEERYSWATQAWSLYQDMISGKDTVRANTHTYAIMLSAWHTFHPNSSMPITQPGSDRSYPQGVDYSSLLDHIRKDEHSISILDVVAHPALSSPEAASEIMRELSRVALDKGDVVTVNELAKAASITSGGADGDALPKAVTVVRHSVEKDGTVSSEVPFNIQNLRNHLAYVAYAKKVLPNDMVARQRHLELSAYEIAELQFKDQTEKLNDIGIDGRFQDKVLQDYMYKWHSELTKRLTKETKMIAMEESKGDFRNSTTELTPYLSLVAPTRLSIITILEVMRLTGTGGIADGMKTTRAMVSIGKAVENEYKVRFCKANDITLPAVPSLHDNVFTEFGYSNLYQRRVAAARQMTMGESWTAPWSQQTRAQVGGVLLECLMDVAVVEKTAIDKKTGKTLTDMQPAFYHSYEFVRGNKLGVIKTNTAVTDRIAKDPLQGIIHPRYLPMLIPPRPWVGLRDGAYLFNNASIMRFKDSVEQEKYMFQSVGNGSAELVLEGLNILGRTPWKINKQVFDVVLEAWNSEKRVGKIPPAVYDQPEPTLPEDNADLMKKSQWTQQMKLYEQDVANNHSERCSVNYKIEIARVFADETIYFPHNLDFRGRAYPIPPHLNHIGDDLSRGLLRFADGKPLGARGFRWLKIHLANLHGYDKADFDARVEWVHERLDLVKDSAKNPMGGSRWWMEADDPWQCLAVCFELTAALESPDPLQFVSYLPVHQDGTCNGLQHYAAMGGDKAGAAQVNLAPVDKPSDVYTFVGDKVEKVIEADAAAGNESAKLLVGKITRKVVKQTVMTTVYGVTFIGARDQLHRQLSDRGDIPEELCWTASAYLARQVLTCIGDTFTGAKLIQNYLNLCARLISKSISPGRFRKSLDVHNDKLVPIKKASRDGRRKGVPAMARFKKEQMTSVIWTTALGLPIVQPYRKQMRKQLFTGLQSVLIADPNMPSEVNSLKQASAFPPNFVHSLDATHMLLTAIETNRRGLTFAAVHDSYWTHACDIDLMSATIRDTFINLHSSDMLKRLADEFKQRYKGYRIPVMHLQSNQTLGKKLTEAGVRIKMSPKQAAIYSSLGNLVEVTEDPSEGATVIESDLALPATPADGLPTAKDLASDLMASLGVQVKSDDAADEWERQSREKEEKKNAERALENARKMAHLMNKFVNLEDVLPPLPEKGSFDVNDIRKSLYFFS